MLSRRILALLTSPTCVSVREASEDDQKCNDEEHTPWPDACGRIAGHVSADRRSVLAPVWPHIVIPAHLVPRPAPRGGVSSTTVRFPLEVLRTVRRRPRFRCHTTIAVVITANTASGIAAGG